MKRFTLIRFIAVTLGAGLLHLFVTAMIVVAGVGQAFAAFNRNTSHEAAVTEMLSKIWNIGAIGATSVLERWHGAPLTSETKNLMLLLWSFSVGLLVASVITIRKKKEPNAP